MNAPIECWLSFNNREEVMRLPVTPFFSVNGGQHNEVINLHNKGDVNLAGNRALIDLQLTSFFPHVGHGYSFVHDSTVTDPWEACKTIKRWKESRRPIRVIITETDVNLAMLIEGFSYGQEDGSRDVHFVLDLKEYLFLDVPRLATADATTQLNAIADSKKGVKEWVVKYGDTLTGIAIAVWGDSSQYKKIVELNKDLIANPNSLKAIAGKVLRLE